MWKFTVELKTGNCIRMVFLCTNVNTIQSRREPSSLVWTYVVKDKMQNTTLIIINNFFLHNVHVCGNNSRFYNFVFFARIIKSEKYEIHPHEVSCSIKFYYQHVSLILTYFKSWPDEKKKCRGIDFGKIITHNISILYRYACCLWIIECISFF